MRCRRHHQGTCRGPVSKSLCAKHRAEWEAYEADRDRRAMEAALAADKKPPRPKRQPWEPWEDDIIHNHTAADAAKKLPHRTEHAVWARRSVLGIATTGWTEEEDNIIRSHPLKTAAKLLPGRSYSAVSQRRIRIGAVATPRARYNAWNAEDDQVLSEHSTADAARILGRTAKAVKARRYVLGIRAPRAPRSDMKGGRVQP